MDEKDYARAFASKGGHARAAALTPERKSEIGRKAAKARLKKYGLKRRPKKVVAATATIFLLTLTLALAAKVTEPRIEPIEAVYTCELTEEELVPTVEPSNLLDPTLPLFKKGDRLRLTYNPEQFVIVLSVRIQQGVWIYTVQAAK